MSSFWWGVLGLGALQLAKVAPFLEGSWRYIGGGTIVFQAIKTHIFGKLIRTIEYPEGEMVSFIIRTNNLNRFKWEIIRRQDPLFPGADLVAADIKHVARWTPPHFTEPCSRNRDMKLIPDGGIIFWSRNEPIPRRHVTLELKDREQIKTDMAIKYVVNLGSKATEERLRLTQPEVDSLVELFLEKDETLITIYRNFHSQSELFKCYALRYVQRRLNKKPPSTTPPPPPSSPLPATSPSSAAPLLHASTQPPPSPSPPPPPTSPPST